MSVTVAAAKSGQSSSLQTTAAAGSSSVSSPKVVASTTSTATDDSETGQNDAGRAGMSEEDREISRARAKRTFCMSRPKHVTPKFVPPSPVSRKVHYSTVDEANQNWRLNQLAVPKNRREKYDVWLASVMEQKRKQLEHAGVSVPMDDENPCYQKPVTLLPGEIPTVQRKNKACLKETLDMIDSNIPERVDHMSRNNIRTLLAQRRAFGKLLGPAFVHKMNERIDQSWNSIYNYYKKCEEVQRQEREERKRRRMESRRNAARAARREREKHKKKGGAARKEKTGKKKKKDKGGGGSDGTESLASSININRLERLIKWCTLRAQPKKRFPPTPLPPRKIADLPKIMPHLTKLAIPKHVYVPPSKDKELLRLYKVSPKALKYQATDYVKRLAEPPEHRLIKEEIPLPGSVKPDALVYEPTPRILELAIPKKKQTSPGENDIRTDAFQVSPAALRYKATPRILDLARPTERT